jgi:hypothetical protein
MGTVLNGNLDVLQTTGAQAGDQVGRYQLFAAVTASQSAQLYKIDTVTGETWIWHNGSPSGWFPMQSTQ